MKQRILILLEELEDISNILERCIADKATHQELSMTQDESSGLLDYINDQINEINNAIVDLEWDK